MAPEPVKANTPSPPAGGMDRRSMIRALGSLLGIALVFALFAVTYTVLVPDDVGVPKESVSSIAMTVVGALLVATLVIAAIFGIMYVYDSQVKPSHEARIKSVKRNLESISSPARAAVTTIVTLAWMAVIYLFWRDIPILMELNSGATMPLFSEKFAAFVPLFLFLGAATIVVNVLYLFVKSKWLPLAGEVALSAGGMMLIYWIIQAFPFNDALSDLIKTGIYWVLVLLLLAIGIGTLANIWKMVKFILYGEAEEKVPA
jgi:hypothetical protein